MMCSATGSKYGDQWAIVAATGCNTVYTSTYPYNPYLVPWTNSLFENAPADAMGVRMRWDQKGWQDKPLWCIGGDGAMFDIGFQSLSRLLASERDSDWKPMSNMAPSPPMHHSGLSCHPFWSQRMRTPMASAGAFSNSELVHGTR